MQPRALCPVRLWYPKHSLQCRVPAKVRVLIRLLLWLLWLLLLAALKGIVLVGCCTCNHPISTPKSALSLRIVIVLGPLRLRLLLLLLLLLRCRVLLLPILCNWMRFWGQGRGRKVFWRVIEGSREVEFEAGLSRVLTCAY